MEGAMSSASRQMQNARNALETYNSQISLGTRQITGGLTPAMIGLDTRKLEQIGVNTQKHHTLPKTTKQH
jgi:hypothetical protein